MYNTVQCKNVSNTIVVLKYMYNVIIVKDKKFTMLKKFHASTPKPNPQHATAYMYPSILTQHNCCQDKSLNSMPSYPGRIVISLVFHIFLAVSHCRPVGLLSGIDPKN